MFKVIHLNYLSDYSSTSIHISCKTHDNYFKFIAIDIFYRPIFCYYKAYSFYNRDNYEFKRIWYNCLRIILTKYCLHVGVIYDLAAFLIYLDIIYLVLSTKQMISMLNELLFSVDQPSVLRNCYNPRTAFDRIW